MAETRMIHQTQRGIALITTLFIMVVLMLLMLPLMEGLRNEIMVTGAHGTSNSALRAAYMGVEEMTYQFELNDSGAAPGVVPAPQNGVYSDDTGNPVTYTSTVTQQWTTVPLPYFLIHSVGTSGGSTRNIDAVIQKQPYSAYGIFTISENTNVGGVVFYASGETFDGPVYSGGPMRIFYDSVSPPIFTSTVTTSQPPLWVPGLPTTGANWASIISNQSDFHQVSQPLTLPTAQDNSAVQDAAYTGNPSPASTPAFPVVAGLYINGANVTGGGGGPVTTGLYIHGGAWVTSAATANTETFTFAIGVLTYHVTLDFLANTTTVTNALFVPVASYTGVPSGEQPPGVVGANGALWIDGGAVLNANNVYHGKYTIALNDNAVGPNPSLWVFGSQTYQDPTKDELAYWANDIRLNDTVNGNIEIDGLMLTGYYGECSVVCTDGTFSNIYCNAVPVKCQPPGGTGTLTLFGSLIENVRGKRGTLGGAPSGFDTNAVFDPRLAKTPPPFTPTTTQYNVLALCTTDNGTTCGQ
jgi:hypothetical protein